MEIKPRIFEPAHADVYLARVIAEEREALLATRRASTVELPEVPYFIHRSRIAEFAIQELDLKLQQALPSDPLRVLFLGEGEGNGANSFLNYCTRKFGTAWKNIVDITLTSLEPFPSHVQLQEQGVQVATGILAEQLTTYGMGQFDIIATDSFLGWTDMNYSLPQIRDSLVSGGVWVGLEARGRGTGFPWSPSAGELQDIIEGKLREHHMEPSLPFFQRMSAVLGKSRRDGDKVYKIRYVRE